jgi:hypothetical protein
MQGMQTFGERFWSHVRKTEDDSSCWIWLAGLEDRGDDSASAARLVERGDPGRQSLNGTAAAHALGALDER